MITERATTPTALFRAAHDNAGGQAIADGDVRLTWAQLHAEVVTMSRCYAARGIESGDRVAVWAPNTHHWVIAALGVHNAGATLVPINTRYTGHEALDILQRTRAKALVVAAPFLGVDRLAKLREAAGPDGLPDLTTVIQIPTDDPAPPPDGVIAWADIAEVGSVVSVNRMGMRSAQVKPSDISDILFTSGTTGRSKGVMTSHEQALGVARAWAECGQLTKDDRYLIINPFFHSFGYKAGILACVATGATMVPQSVFDIDRAMELVEAEKITVLPGPPTIYQSMLDHPGDRDLSSLRLAVTGAATVPVALVEKMQTEMSFQAVLTAYGLTEAVVVTMCRPDDSPEVIAHSSGRATAGFEVRIADGTGEILLRGPNVMKGYLDDPDATAQAIDADGWLHTGDIGVLDDNGYLAITDRLKDMYICGGFNVYPAEVEQALARLEGVSESVVIGVADDRMGEVGKAFVIRRPDATITDEDVLAHAKELLANYKVPRYVEFRDDVPRNATGKPLKRLLRDEEKAT